jgi:anti-sigma B factor antagonist
MRNNTLTELDGLPYGATLAQAEPFGVEVRLDRRCAFVAPRGELDLDTVDAVAAQVEDLVGRGFDAIVIDLRAISFMDSSGVHLLVKYARRGDVRMTVVDGPPAVSRVLDLAEVRDVLPFETTR